MSSQRHYTRAKRELKIILLAWLSYCIWVVGYCALNAYDEPGSELATTLGMPSWVFWGIAVPWLAATGFTIVFGFGLLKDQPYDDGEGGGRS